MRKIHITTPVIALIATICSTAGPNVVDSLGNAPHQCVAWVDADVQVTEINHIHVDGEALHLVDASSHSASGSFDPGLRSPI